MNRGGKVKRDVRLQLASKDAIFTVDTGMTCVWGARYLHGTGERKMLGSFNHGSMANAVPQAIGASLAFPERQVWALCGDGGISMLLGDLSTIVQYKFVKIVVFNNRLGCRVTGLADGYGQSRLCACGKSDGMEGFTVSGEKITSRAGS